VSYSYISMMLDAKPYLGKVSLFLQSLRQHVDSRNLRGRYDFRGGAI
jgi:hypothetical protein